MLALTAILLVGCVPSHRVAVEPAPDVDCAPGPFIAFFDRNSAALDSGSTEILANVGKIATEPCWDTAAVTISGFKETDEDGGVSRARAVAVRDYLAVRGVGARRIRIEDFGSNRPRMAEVSGEPNRQNRRIEIVFTYLTADPAADTRRR